MKRIIICGVPHHGNIGDHAISVAQETLINDNLEGYEIYEVPEKNLHLCADKLKKYIKPDDIICLQGGGNIGDIYEKPERGKRKIIQNFPNNKIIIFPQTIYFSDTEKGRKELEISKEIYNSHPDLTIAAREQKTYDFVKKEFPNVKVLLTSDTVMYLDKTDLSKKREGVVMNVRSDAERVFSDADQQKLEEIVKKNYSKIVVTDNYMTELKSNLATRDRDKVLAQKFEEFQTAELAITDRLHGMIFAAITSTPCVAFTNFNFKIKESFKWLEHLGYIEFCDDINDLEEKIKKVTSIKNPRYNNGFAKETLLKLIENL